MSHTTRTPTPSFRARWRLIITAIAAILAATPFINVSTLRAAWRPVIQLVYQNPSDAR